MQRIPRWLRLLIAVATVAAVVLTLRGKLPDPGDLLAALRSANPFWLVVAAVAEAFSLRFFAHQQRRLLLAFGVPTTMHRAMALTVSRSAIAIGLPAGSAVSSGFAYKQFRVWGASRQTATTVMILSGFISFAGLAMLYLTGAAAHLIGGLGEVIRDHPGMAGALGVLAAVIGVAGVGSVLTREPRATSAPVTAESAVAPAGWLARKIWPVRAALREAGAVPWRHWQLALLWAVLSWVADLACLLAATQAFHLQLGFFDLAAPYLAIQLIRQFPVTPGGIGLIEASLLTALVSAGAAQAPAAAAVLGYRLFSCWLILPAGLVTWLSIRRGERRWRIPDTPAAVPETAAAYP
ncbi:lysylphosphatidylglycerol synthase transmembrane domain-containing protein [Luedemannella helvata]|uniref:YbhN family protein n=1 Tax=Luedemannella helvata TaxID=349315 RepID=A0ABP4WCD2_9ACTN